MASMPGRGLALPSGHALDPVSRLGYPRSFGLKTTPDRRVAPTIPDVTWGTHDEEEGTEEEEEEQCTEEQGERWGEGVQEEERVFHAVVVRVVGLVVCVVVVVVDVVVATVVVILVVVVAALHICVLQCVLLANRLVLASALGAACETRAVLGGPGRV